MVGLYSNSSFGWLGVTVCWTGKWLHDKGSYRVYSGDLDEFVE